MSGAEPEGAARAALIARVFAVLRRLAGQSGTTIQLVGMAAALAGVYRLLGLSWALVIAGCVLVVWGALREAGGK